MSQPITHEDIKQEVNTAKAMKAADYSKPDLQNKQTRAKTLQKAKGTVVPTPHQTQGSIQS